MSMNKELMHTAGDNESTAERVAQELSIQDFAAGLLPQDKLAQIERLRQEAAAQGSKRPGIVMVGDGINDAPALAAADVGEHVQDCLPYSLQKVSFHGNI